VEGWGTRQISSPNLLKLKLNEKYSSLDEESEVQTKKITDRTVSELQQKRVVPFIRQKKVKSSMRYESARHFDNSVPTASLEQRLDKMTKLFPNNPDMMKSLKDDFAQQVLSNRKNQ